MARQDYYEWLEALKSFGFQLGAMKHGFAPDGQVWLLDNDVPLMRIHHWSAICTHRVKDNDSWFPILEGLDAIRDGFD
jgi:hypothetical protein